MKHRTEIITVNDIDIAISYDFEEEKGYYAETGNPYTWVFPTLSVELTNAEILILDKMIDILPLLTEKQIDKIKSCLKCE